MKYILFLCLFGLTLYGFSQVTPPEDASEDESSAETSSVTDEEKREKIGIEGKYRKVVLGMSREEVINVLKKDSYLEIDETTDYGDFDEEQKYLVKAKRKPFIDHIYYQFIKKSTAPPTEGEAATANEKQQWVLYAIIIKFNTKYNNYVSLYEKILSKYGEADVRTAKYALWKSAGRELSVTANGKKPVKLILNSPSTIKIIDALTYQQKFVEEKQTSEEAVKDYQRKLNEELLSDFVPSEKDDAASE